jgi:hypothetical protein
MSSTISLKIAVRGMRILSAHQLIHATLRDNLQIVSLRPVDRDVEPRPY